MLFKDNVFLVIEDGYLRISEIESWSNGDKPEHVPYLCLDESIVNSRFCKVTVREIYLHPAIVDNIIYSFPFEQCLEENGWYMVHSNSIDYYLYVEDRVKFYEYDTSTLYSLKTDDIPLELFTGFYTPVKGGNVPPLN